MGRTELNRFCEPEDEIPECGLNFTLRSISVNVKAAVEQIDDTVQLRAHSRQKTGVLHANLAKRVFDVRRQTVLIVCSIDTSTVPFLFARRVQIVGNAFE